MANSWQNPRLATPIRTDVPELQEKLIALLKQDPTPISDIPVGAKRLYEASSGKWQWQLYNGSSWAPVPFLHHNVDQLDGYHAAITPAANTVAVRGTDGKLKDDITGNAATATTAATLSQTLPVNKGGTGATTSEAARANLGVPPTSHASTNTTHGVGNATQYGHLKLSDAANSSSGVSGGVAATPAAVKAAKDAADAAQSSANNAQSSADAAMVKASTVATASTTGIVKPGTGMTVDAAGALNVTLNNTVTSTSTKQAATANAVKTAYDKAVEAEAVLPAGFVIAFAANSNPSGYLLCNGAAVSRTTYKALFAAIGTTYGTGDGSTTFNLPNLTDMFIQGSGTAGTVKRAGLPNITGKQQFAVAGEGSTGTGAFSVSYQRGAVGGYTTSNLAYYKKGIGIASTIINASNASSIYGASTTVQPPAVTMRYYIKY